MAKDRHRATGVKGRSSTRWIVEIFVITFFLSMGMSLVSESMATVLSLLPATLVLLTFIAIGIFFDILGIAVASADAVPFASMAAKKVRGADMALRLIQAAARVSSVCNDVVGDICGIISGATGATIALEIVRLIGRSGAAGIWVSVMVSSCVAALTVGGKAFGKRLAMERSRDIVLAFGRFLSVFKRMKKARL